VKPEIQAAGRSLTDPLTYTDETVLHDALTLLRTQAPIHWVDAPGYRPFWALTRHRHLVEVERAADRFTNAPRPVLLPAAVEERMAAHGGDLRVLIHLDGSEHRVTRAIAAAWFNPRSLASIRQRIAALAARTVDRMVELGGRCDFVSEVANQFPLFAILPLLGLPDKDAAVVRRLSQEFLGHSDSGHGRADGHLVDVKAEILSFFSRLTADRRRTPTDDLASAIANARVGGELLSEHDVNSYYFLIASAGHDTVRAVLAGGLNALIEYPEQLDVLQQNLDLVPRAVEEMIRWVSPTKTLLRTAVTDYVLDGVTIRAGDSVLLNYASANRDEEVFSDPFRFAVDRRPNQHLAFGHGPHVCLGAAYARLQLELFFTELLARLTELRRAGEPRLIASVFVGGLKRLPISYRLS